MPVLIRIAFRNMREHKAKSFIIGILVALGVVVLVLGNSMMDASAQGIRKTFIENFTGDVMIHGPSENAVSIFGVQSMSMGADTEIPTIPDYDKVVAHVKEDPAVAAYTSMAVAYGMVTMDAGESIQDSEGEDRDNVVFGILFGVDADTYFSMFPAVKLSSGRLLKRGEAAALLSSDQIKKLEKKYDRTFAVGDKVLITGLQTGGFKIREVAIVGIYERDEDGASGAPFIYVDIDTARVLGGLTLGTDEAADLDKSQTALLDASASDFDSLFDDDSMVTAAPTAGAAGTFDSAADLVGDTSKRDLLNTADTGAWNFILIRLKDSGSPVAAASEVAALGSWFSDQGIAASATDWKGAAGSFGSFADIVRTVFTIAIVIIAVVSIIIMMNTLVISVIERTAEIGTMRALGAQKGFVRRMFLTETLTITVVFGFIGAAVALLATFVLNRIGIEATNPLLRLLFGGAKLHLVPRLGSFLVSIFMVFLVGWLAHLYPVSVALKIPPVKAMQSE